MIHHIIRLTRERAIGGSLQMVGKPVAEIQLPEALGIDEVLSVLKGDAAELQPIEDRVSPQIDKA